MSLKKRDKVRAYTVLAKIKTITTRMITTGTHLTGITATVIGQLTPTGPTSCEVNINFAQNLPINANNIKATATQYAADLTTAAVGYGNYTFTLTGYAYEIRVLRARFNVNA